MKEITRVITARITYIEKVEDEKELATREQVYETFGLVAKEMLCADNLVIDNVQDFVHEGE